MSEKTKIIITIVSFALIFGIVLFVIYLSQEKSKEEIVELVPEITKTEIYIKQLSVGPEFRIGPEDGEIVFLRFEASAKGEDILLSKLVFMHGHGDPSEKEYGNLSLWVDTNKDGLTDFRPNQIFSVDSLRINRFAVENIEDSGFLIPKDQTFLFELRASAKTLMDNKDAMIILFAVEPGESYIVANKARSGEVLTGIQTTTWDTQRISTDSYCRNFICELFVDTARHTKVWFNPDKN